MFLQYKSDAVMEMQLVLSSIFMSLMPSVDAQKKMKITGLSQRLLGTAPGWYLWRADMPGAYLVEIASACHERLPKSAGMPAASRPDCIKSICHIKYYPALQHDTSFEGLSVAEQMLRMDASCFDPTGTPLLERENDIDAGAFLAGFLTITVPYGYGLEQGRQDCICLELSTPERWVECCPNGLTPADLGLDIEGISGETVLVPPGGTDRDLSAWKVTWPVYDLFITAFGLYFTEPPIAMVYCGSQDAKQAQLLGGNFGLSLFSPPVWKVMACFIPGAWKNPGIYADRSVPLPQPAEPFGLLHNWLASNANCTKVAWMLLQPPSEMLQDINLEWWTPSGQESLQDIGLCCLVGHGV